jgi:hypothetical protein
MNLGISGKLTRATIQSPLTPLMLLAAIIVGLIATITIPREEEPQIRCRWSTSWSWRPACPRPKRSNWSASRWKQSSRASTEWSTSTPRPKTTA